METKDPGKARRQMDAAAVYAQMAVSDELRDLGTKLDTLTAHVVDLEHAARFTNDY